MKGMTFGKKAALALTGVSGRQLEHWAVSGIVRPSVKVAAGKGSRREYSFQDLVALKLAKRLRTCHGSEIPPSANKASNCMLFGWKGSFFSGFQMISTGVLRS